MPRCPNCFYALVLLEHRRKYKCAKCSGLFKKREIEDKEFVVWNKKRRIEEKVKVGKELKELGKIRRKRKPRLSEEERLKRSKASHKKWVANNREYYNKSKREYWARNKKRLLENKRKNYHKRKAKILSQQALYRQNNKTLSRIKYLRNQQKVLTLRKFEFNIERALNI